MATADDIRQFVWGMDSYDDLTEEEDDYVAEHLENLLYPIE